MIDNTDKVVAAILAAGRFQKLSATSAQDIVACYDECIAALITSRAASEQKLSRGAGMELRLEQNAWEQHERDYGGG